MQSSYPPCLWTEGCEWIFPESFAALAPRICGRILPPQCHKIFSQSGREINSLSDALSFIALQWILTELEPKMSPHPPKPAKSNIFDCGSLSALRCNFFSDFCTKFNSLSNALILGALHPIFTEIWVFSYFSLSLSTFGSNFFGFWGLFLQSWKLMLSSQELTIKWTGIDFFCLVIHNEPTWACQRDVNQFKIKSVHRCSFVS